MRQIINKQEIQNSVSKEFIIKCTNKIEQANFELKRITERTSGAIQDKAYEVVREILHNVSKRGDEALLEYTQTFDGFLAKPLQISSEQILKAWDRTPGSLQNALLTAKKRIEIFHNLQVPKNISYTGPHGEILGRQWNPVEKAGIYVPGG